MAIQQQIGQVGMQVAGDVADRLKAQADDAVKNANAALIAAETSGDPAAIAQAQANLYSAQQQDLLWGADGAGRDALHAVVAGAGAAMGGGNVAGAVGGTIAGDVASGYSRDLFGNDLGGTILSNITSGAAGALAGGALGGVGGALSGANGATSADLYNRQIHKEDETQAIKDKANNDPAEEKRLTLAACYVVQCWAEYETGSEAWQATYVSPQQAADLTGEIAWVENQQTTTGLFLYTNTQKAWDRILAGDDALWNTAAGGVGQFLALMHLHSGQTPPSDADPFTDITNNTPPPAQGGSYVPIAQCAGAVCAVVPVPTPGAPGYVPDNATLSSGSDDGVTANSGVGAYDRVFGGRTSVENVTSRGTSIESVPNGNDVIAANDFAALKPDSVKTVSTARGDATIGTFDDGSTVILRPSKDGRTTIEFQNANGRTTKEIRYGSN